MTVAERKSSPAPPVPTPHRWMVEDYLRADEAGAFGCQRVELVEGEIIDMPAQHDPHAWTISRVYDALRKIFPDPYWVKIQATLRLGESSAPEPDIVVMSGPPSPPAPETPTALLIVEVSESTLQYDRRRKASLYAKAGIPDYWVADVAGKQVEDFRNPASDASQPYGWGYQQVTVFKLQDRLAPLARPELSVEVAAFLA